MAQLRAGNVEEAAALFARRRRARSGQRRLRDRSTGSRSGKPGPARGGGDAAARRDRQGSAPLLRVRQPRRDLRRRSDALGAARRHRRVPREGARRAQGRRQGALQPAARAGQLRARDRPDGRGARAPQPLLRRSMPTRRCRARSASACSTCWRRIALDDRAHALDDWPRPEIARADAAPGRRRRARARQPGAPTTRARSPRRWCSATRPGRARWCCAPARSRPPGRVDEAARDLEIAVNLAPSDARGLAHARARSWRSTAARWRPSAPTMPCATRSRWSRAGPTCASCATSWRAGAPSGTPPPSPAARPCRRTSRAASTSRPRSGFTSAIRWASVASCSTRRWPTRPGSWRPPSASYALSGQAAARDAGGAARTTAPGCGRWPRACASSVRRARSRRQRRRRGAGAPARSTGPSRSTCRRRGSRARYRARGGRRSRGGARRSRRLRRARAAARSTWRRRARCAPSSRTARARAAMRGRRPSCWRASACSRTSPTRRCARWAGPARARCPADRLVALGLVQRVRRPALAPARACYELAAAAGGRSGASGLVRAGATSTPGCPTRSCARPTAARSRRRPAARHRRRRVGAGAAGRGRRRSGGGARAHRPRAGAGGRQHDRRRPLGQRRARRAQAPVGRAAGRRRRRAAIAAACRRCRCVVALAAVLGLMARRRWGGRTVAARAAAAARRCSRTSRARSASSATTCSSTARACWARSRRPMRRAPRSRAR